jgi:hypothetical protein
VFVELAPCLDGLHHPADLMVGIGEIALRELGFIPLAIRVIAAS